MKTTIDNQAAARLLEQMDDIVILPHKNPDGDAIGSALGLMYGLWKLGKHVRIESSDPFPGKYDYIMEPYRVDRFEARHIVSVDLADTKLLGDKTSVYARRIELAFDHHPSNTGFAVHTCLHTEAAATCEIIFDILSILGVALDKVVAECLYTGISTDTGCFRYSNTTADTHRIAAELYRRGARAGMINRIMFETKSRGLIELERMALNSMEFHRDGRCAIVVITQDMMQSTGVYEDELDGITALARRIEGVEAGFTVRERAERDGFRVSLRTNEIDASRVLQALGGGGHARAAGCSVNGTLDSVKAKLLQALDAAAGR